MKTFFFTALFLIFDNLIFAQNTPVGQWKTMDEKSGKSKGIIEFFEKDGMLFGKIVKVSNDTLNHICDKCPGERRGKRMMGMVIFENLKQKDGFWKDGRVLNPKAGKWYDLQIWLESGDPNTLIVRGSWGPFYKTQRWTRV
jgi:uncharacterized protein (DUF2147 family)